MTMKAEAAQFVVTRALDVLPTPTIPKRDLAGRFTHVRLKFAQVVVPDLEFAGHRGPDRGLAAESKHSELKDEIGVLRPTWRDDNLGLPCVVVIDPGHRIRKPGQNQLRELGLEPGHVPGAGMPPADLGLALDLVEQNAQFLRKFRPGGDRRSGQAASPRALAAFARISAISGSMIRRQSFRCSNSAGCRAMIGGRFSANTSA